MAEYRKVRSKYEFLMRLDDDVLVGAHVGFRTKTYEDNVVIADNIEPVMPVNIGVGVEGFPLADIVGELTTGLIIQVEDLNQKLVTVTEQRDQLVTTNGELSGEITGLKAELAKFQEICAKVVAAFKMPE